MKVSKGAYALLDEKLSEMESRACDGILNGNARDVCMTMRGLVFDLRQIINNEFYLDDTDGDEPPAA